MIETQRDIVNRQLVYILSFSGGDEFEEEAENQGRRYQSTL